MAEKQNLQLSIIVPVYGVEKYVRPCIDSINPTNITNTSEERIAQIIRSRTLSCRKILDNPPKFPWPEYYTYAFYVLSRGIDLLENNAGTGNLRDAIYNQRSRLLKEVKSKRYYLLYFFFLTSVKPFFYLTKLWFYRRYFDRLSKVCVSWIRYSG